MRSIKNRTPDKVKWPLMINDLTWGKVIYGILNQIRNAEKDLPIENTIAIFLMEPNRVSTQKVNDKKSRTRI